MKQIEQLTPMFKNAETDAVMVCYYDDIGLGIECFYQFSDGLVTSAHHPTLYDGIIGITSTQKLRDRGMIS